MKAQKMNYSNPIARQIMVLTTCFIFLTAQSQDQSQLGVISFDANSSELNQTELTELLRIEISKHERYEMFDRYEINDVLRENEINPAECFSKTCLIKAGEFLKVDKVITASADKLGEALFLRLRLVDVKAKVIEKEVVKEFLFIPEKVNTMVSICVNELMGKDNDMIIVNSLTNRDSYDNAINNPYYQRLNLSGPRLGYTLVTGLNADRLKADRSEGGFEVYPALFQMGYQFEQQYLNEGEFQALFEFIPMVTGIDQGLFIPSFTILNGLRSNKNGLEFAIGPSVSFNTKSKGYFANGQWNRLGGEEAPEGVKIEEVLDYRGNVKLNSSVIIAAGMSLKSGKLSIPVNVYAVPAKEGWRFGFSFGFNGKNMH